MKLPRTLGRPASRSHEQTLLRALVRPMLERVRATIRAGRVTTLGDCRALGVALRKAYPDERVRTIVGSVGTAAELAASRPWGRLERAAAKPPRSVSVTVDTLAPHVWESPLRVYVMDAGRKYDGPQLVEKWTKDATSRITSVRDEIAEGLRRDVIAAAEAGTDADALAAKWLSEGVPVEWGTAEGRLRAIAQNQLSTLHAQVQSERARAVGVTAFVWRTQGDDRVRDAHQALDGTRHDYADPPSEGLPGEPINCFPGDTPVFLDDDTEALYGRAYRGDLVEVHFGDRVLRATPNHPVGTLRGWVPAEQLQVGDHLIDASGYVAHACDNNGVESELQVAWDLLQILPRRRLAGVAFHGDATVDEQVDVVRVDWRLMIDGNPQGAQPITNRDFAGTDRTTPSMSTLAQLRLLSRLAADGGVSLRGPSGALFWRCLAHALEHRSRTIAQRNPSLQQPALDDEPAAPDLLCQLLQGCPGLVAPYEIVKVGRMRDLVVRVHNLQTSSGIFAAQGVVVHNCRCWAESVIDDELALELGFTIG